MVLDRVFEKTQSFVNGRIALASGIVLYMDGWDGPGHEKYINLVESFIIDGFRVLCFNFVTKFQNLMRAVVMGCYINMALEMATNDMRGLVGSIQDNSDHEIAVQEFLSTPDSQPLYRFS